MEKLIELSKGVSDGAEVYWLQNNSNNVSFENAKLQNIDSKLLSGASLRIIKNGRTGFACTRNLQNREEFLQNALVSLQGGVQADYKFPFTAGLPGLDTYDASLEKVSNTALVNECERISTILKSKTNGEITVYASANISHIRIMNTAGTDIASRGTGYYMSAGVIFPGSAAGITRTFVSKSFAPMPDSLINEIIHLYNAAAKTVTPEGGPMKVIFMPDAVDVLLRRILVGLSGKSIYEKISPVADKAGQRILSEQLTIYDDPLNDRYPGARTFDDEGTACRNFPFIENGVLKDFFYDLNYAGKLKAMPSGHGYKTGPGGGDPITLRPMPGTARLCIKPGKKSFADMVKSIDRGIILEGTLGAHSGNVPNGDYSVGVNPALYVENGEIIGRVKDAMVAGNVYQTLKDVIDVGDAVSYMGKYIVPPVLCNGVSVVTKH